MALIDSLKLSGAQMIFTVRVYCMPGLLPDVDPDGLLEYSVVYTDRAVNHMSGAFQSVMRDISATLKQVYKADAAVIVPGSGTFGMEAVARQFANDKHCLIIRNGWFSFRWTQILEMGNMSSQQLTMKNPPLFLHRMSRHHRECCCPTII